MKSWFAMLSTRTLLTLGLSSIVVCGLLMADLFKLVPDRTDAVRQGRAVLTQSVALGSTVFLARQDSEGLAQYLDSVRQRSPDVTAIWLVQAGDGFSVKTGVAPPDTAAATIAAADTASSDTRMTLPLLVAGERWGSLVVWYRADNALLDLAPWLPKTTPLVVFLGLVCALAFHLYLGRMLRHLDPSNAIPPRVRAAFDTLAEGLMVVDPNGDIVLANKALAAVLGVDADALIGRNAARLPWQARRGQTGQGASPELPWLDVLRSNHLRMSDSLSLVDTEGLRRSFMINSAPIPGPSGKAVGVLVSLDDVTDLEQKELELVLARDEADAANRAKSDFLANMSHEIRTPMNAILGFTELLRRGRSHDAAESRRLLDIVHHSGKHLLGLINDILDLSKVEAGRLEVERTACAAHRVVAEAARTLQVKADEKGVALDLRFATALPATISTDPSRLRQVVTNLIGNAIKFTERGHVRLVLSFDPGLPARLRIDISDTGIGIAAHRLESIFEPFVQAETSTTRRFGGTGLGLTISRRLARALGGDVVASSTPGKGSTFHVTLDAGDLQGVTWLEPDALQAAIAQDEPAASGDAVGWRFQGQRVLVVDDGAENRELVRLVLSEVGLTVFEADNGLKALDAVREQQPDVVLMDIQMPVMDGSQATRALRAQGCQLPIFALTANAMKGFEAEIASAGFTGHLVKPIDIDALLQTLAELLGAERLQPATPQLRVAAEPVLAAALPHMLHMPHLPHLPNAAAVAPGVQAPAGAPLVSRLASHPKLARVVRSFCAQLPQKMELLRNQLDQGAFQDLEASAHWLKGAGGSVGFDDFFEPSRQLEQAAKQQDAASAGQWLDTIADLAARVTAPALVAAVPAQTPATVGS